MFLKNVELIRPSLFMRPELEAGKLPGIRMPSFPITDDEATAVAEYFASVSNHEAKDLKQRLDTSAGGQPDRGCLWRRTRLPAQLRQSA